MRINHNMVAIFANRQIQSVSNRVDRSIERLSSGEVINRAGDDASGLAVSEKMRTQIRGLIQAEKNAQNGLSFIQVAEGSFQQLNDIMQRVRELSIQSANGIYSPSDRVQIQAEVSQLIDEVDRIATSAEFNRMKMLTGNFSKKNPKADMFFHVGANQGQRIKVYIATVSAQALKLAAPDGKKLSVSSAQQANDMIGVVDDALDKLTRQRADLGAYYNRMENTIIALTKSYENQIAADSRIRDVDMASQMVDFAKDQVLLQAGISMLAQANVKPQLVMKLIE